MPGDVAAPGTFYASNTNRMLKAQYQDITKTGPLDAITQRTALPRLNQAQLEALKASWEERGMTQEQITTNLSLHPLTSLYKGRKENPENGETMELGRPRDTGPNQMVTRGRHI